MIPQNWLKSFRTEYGDIKVSLPELTASDLITFQKEIGGLNRACTVLYELVENLDFEKLDKDFFDFVPTSTIQRLGYLLNNELEQADLSENSYKKTKEFDCKFQKIPLKNGKSTENCETNSKWKIIINERIEIGLCGSGAFSRQGVGDFADLGKAFAELAVRLRHLHIVF
jgi:hypothetical protein